MVLDKELEKAFGLVFEISENVEKSGLPRYLVSGRSFFKAEYEQFLFYIIRLRGAADSRVLAKEMQLYKEKFDAPVAFWFDELTKNNRNAYVKHHIPFIMIPTQIYLPFLGVLFSRKFSESVRNTSFRLTFNAQKILFFLMYNKKEEYSKKELAIDLALDPVYVTRGSKELVARGFVKERKEGKNTFVKLVIEPKELLELGNDIFVTPVSDVIHIKRTDEVKELLKASDYALSEISMLNPPSVETYACFKKSEIIREFEILDEPEWEEPDSICRIELWNYDPKQLSDKDRVDKLSLFSSLKDTKDPRVQGEIETVLEEIEWQ